MLVIAATGLLVPMEEKPRSYISDTPPEGAKGFEVPDTVYYRRRILDGDLVELTGSSAPAEAVVIVDGAKKRGGK